MDPVVASSLEEVRKESLGRSEWLLAFLDPRNLSSEDEKGFHEANGIYIEQLLLWTVNHHTRSCMLY